MDPSYQLSKNICYKKYDGNNAYEKYCETGNMCYFSLNFKLNLTPFPIQFETKSGTFIRKELECLNYQRYLLCCLYIKGINLE